MLSLFRLPNNSAQLYWNGAAGATEYIVWRATSYSGDYAMVGTSSTSSYTDTSSLVCGTMYYYKVASTNGVTTSGYSNISAVTIVPATAALTGIRSYSATAIKMVWDKVDGANGYYIYRSLMSAPGNYSRVGTVTSGSTLYYIDTGLTTGTAYNYKVSAFRTVNGTNIEGGYSNEMSAIPVPLPPSTITPVSAGYNSITVSWSAVSGATSYGLAPMRIFLRKAP